MTKAMISESPRHYSVLHSACPEMAQAVTARSSRLEGQVVLDGTTGLGGHTAILGSLFPKASLIALDADRKMLALAKKRLEPFKDRLYAVNTYFDDYFKKVFPESLDLAFFDLGLSTYHYKGRGSGFSFERDEPLDMRLGGKGPTAAYLLASLSEADLARLLRRGGEERFARLIARKIVGDREKAPITSSQQLSSLVERALGPHLHGRSRRHPATTTFQALRIAVNGELERLERLIPLALSSLKVGGVLGIITFHSLEDKIVKESFGAALAVPGGGRDKYRPRPSTHQASFKLLFGKSGRSASEQELLENPPSRSARLRAVKKILSVEEQSQ